MAEFQVEINYLRANVNHSIRFTQKLYERLRLVGKKKHVSFNSLVLQCCEFALDHMDMEDKAKTELEKMSRTIG